MASSVICTAFELQAELWKPLAVAAFPQRTAYLISGHLTGVRIGDVTWRNVEFLAGPDGVLPASVAEDARSHGEAYERRLGSPVQGFLIAIYNDRSPLERMYGETDVDMIDRIMAQAADEAGWQSCLTVADALREFGAVVVDRHERDGLHYFDDEAQAWVADPSAPSLHAVTAGQPSA